MAPIVEAKRRELIELCGRYHVRRLDLFGSATSDAFDPAHSDLDFLVEFLPLQLGEHFDAYFGLLEGLQELFGRPIDLVEAQAMRNPYFIRRVNESRTPIYAA